MTPQVIITGNDLPVTVTKTMQQICLDLSILDKTVLSVVGSSNTHYAIYYIGTKLIGFAALRIGTIKLGGLSKFLIYLSPIVAKTGFDNATLVDLTYLAIGKKYWSKLIVGNALFWTDAFSPTAYACFAKNLKNVYPTYRKPTPWQMEELLLYIGQAYYPTTFHIRTGTVQASTFYPTPRKETENGWKEADADIQFFKATNPKYYKGFGLLTIAPLTFGNWFYLWKKTYWKVEKSPPKELYEEMVLC